MPDLDWENLGFRYRPTAGHIRYTWKNGSWSEGKTSTDPTLNISIAAGVLHYGQACFEGGKVFRGADGEIYMFRPQANAQRLNQSLDYLVAPAIPEAMYMDAVRQVVKMNEAYIPPRESRGALYIRPVVFASEAQVGLNPADQYEFIVFCTPVGDYYKGGMHAVDAIILDEYDRAAPHGTGHIKAAGNYAASLYACQTAKHMGFPMVLFLDALTHTKVEEFSSSNFLAITKEGHYVTPQSHSILLSITNESLQILAQSMGIPVESRPIDVSELSEFTEVAACGTAVVITPVRRIVRGNQTYQYGEGCGPVLQKLYDAFRAIQYGERPDPFGWLVKV